MINYHKKHANSSIKIQLIQIDFEFDGFKFARYVIPLTPPPLQTSRYF